MSSGMNNYTPDDTADKQDEEILARIVRQQTGQVPTGKDTLQNVSDGTSSPSDNASSDKTADTDLEQKDYIPEEEETHPTQRKAIDTAKSDNTVATDKQTKTTSTSPPLTEKKYMVRVGIHAPRRRSRDTLKVLLQVIAVAALTGIALLLHWLIR